MSAELIPSTGLAPACCPGLGRGPLDVGAAASLAPAFKALGDPVRLRLMSLIAAADEVCVCDLTDGFEVSAPTISHHLKVLRTAGLVTSQRRGTWVYYRADRETLRRLGGLLDPAGAHLIPDVTESTAWTAPTVS